MAFKLTFLFLAIVFSASAALAQTAAFTFQGKLNDGAIAANGTYQFQFKLFDAATGGNQVGQTIADLPATVTNGIFAVNLDFGASSYDGSPRFIEVGVRLSVVQPYTILNPRQAVASTPYAVKSLKSDEAVTAITANNSLNLGGIAAAEYVQTTDTRMSDDRNPLPNSPNYIQNGTSLQTTSNFNISGDGRAATFNAVTQYNLNSVRILSGSLSNANLFAGFEAGINNTSSGDGSTFVGVRAGQQNTIGGGNSFFGNNAGQQNISGGGNSFFGWNAGLNNTTGTSNAFFGSQTGASNVNGGDNSFFGQFAGFNNTTGSRNVFIGSGVAQFNTTGANNTFIGFFAGAGNTVESNNTFIGYNANGAAGITNATAIGANSIVSTSDTMVLGTNLVTVQVPGSLNVAGIFSANILNAATFYQIAGNRVFHLTGTNNTFVGSQSGNSNSTGTVNAFFGTEAGKNNTTGFNNAFFGAFSGRANLTGDNNAFFGANAGFSSTNNSNSFFGSNSGFSTTVGNRNAFFGASSGLNNLIGNENAFFGYEAGKSNTANSNSFFGANAGFSTTVGSQNAFFGTSSGLNNLGGFGNSFFGFESGKANAYANYNSFFGWKAGALTDGYGYNAFFGAYAGTNNTTGQYNIFVGAEIGYANTTGSGNVFVGGGAGNSTGDFNTMIGRGADGNFPNQYRNLALGYNASVGALHDAAAIGVDSFASNLFTMVLGTNATTVIVPGGLVNFSFGATRIDHPLDPLNKYLTQTSITSPEMMNVYNGNVQTDANGEAVVTMPAYLETLNRDFRYQLTVIGQFAQAIVGEEIKGNQFKIRTDKPNVKVSWQVTGIRQDAVANQNRVETESLKPENERGTFLNPAAFGKPELLERRKETKPVTAVVPNK